MKNKGLGAGLGVIVILLMAFILGIVHPLGAGSKDGAQLKIVTKDGTKIQGELLAIQATILIIRSADNVAGYSFVLDEIRDLTIVGKSKVRLGSGMGLVVGGLVGALLPVDKNSWVPDLERFGHAVMGAGAGFLLGLVVDSFAAKDEPLIVASVYQLEPDALLKKLRAAAKDPEYR